MSALGHKRTNGPGPKCGFVRYCPKADKRWRGCFVCFVPRADIVARNWSVCNESRKFHDHETKEKSKLRSASYEGSLCVMLYSTG